MRGGRRGAMLAGGNNSRQRRKRRGLTSDKTCRGGRQPWDWHAVPLWSGVSDLWGEGDKTGYCTTANVGGWQERRSLRRA